MLIRLKLTNRERRDLAEGKSTISVEVKVVPDPERMWRLLNLEWQFALKIPGRASSALHDLGLVTVGDVASSTENELRRVKGCGAKAVSEIEQALSEHGLWLGMDLWREFGSPPK